MSDPTLRPCVFLDRDGVINRAAAPGEYILAWEQFHFIDSIVDWIRLFRALGFLAIVVTNQRCVAKGLITHAELEKMHRRMTAELAARGAPLDAVYYCPDEESECRKPRVGMVQQAASDFPIDLERSVVIGDSDNDEQLARNCGLAFVRVQEGRVISVVPR